MHFLACKPQNVTFPFVVMKEVENKPLSTVTHIYIDINVNNTSAVTIEKQKWA